MPLDDLALRPSPRIEPSAAMELSWLVIFCANPNVVAPLPAELKERSESFWNDEHGIQPEVLVLAQQLGCLTGWDVSPLFAFEDAQLDPIADVDMCTETPEQRAAIAERMERLRLDRKLRRRYASLLKEVWDHGLPDFETLGRPITERALQRMRSSLDHGLPPMGLIPDRHIARRDEYVGLTREAFERGTVLLTQCYFAGERGHIVALPGLLSISIGTGLSQDMARRRTEVEGISRGLKLLGDPTRLLILTELEREPATVGEIARRVSIAQPTASVHVKQLREAGFVSATRESSGAVYRVRHDAVRQVLDAARGVTLPQIG